MMLSDRLLILVTVALIGGCSADHDSDSPEELSDTSLPGVYTGTFPCDGCPGIQTTLWLRSDGRFFIRQTFPGDDGGEAMNAYNLGRWSWIAGDDVLVLNGAGPARTFARPDFDTLLMRTHSDIEHRLSRDPGSPDFSSTINMAGMMSMHGGSTSFAECLTGFAAPVKQGAEFDRFLHQYRSAGGRGKSVYVELEGRFIWADDGALKLISIERFITIKTGRSCGS